MGACCSSRQWRDRATHRRGGSHCRRWPEASSGRTAASCPCPLKVAAGVRGPVGEDAVRRSTPMKPVGPFLRESQAPTPPKQARLLGERARTPPFPQTPYPALSFSSLSGSELGFEAALNAALGSKMKVKNWLLTKFLRVEKPWSVRPRLYRDEENQASGGRWSSSAPGNATPAA